MNKQEIDKLLEEADKWRGVQPMANVRRLIQAVRELREQASEDAGVIKQLHKELSEHIRWNQEVRKQRDELLELKGANEAAIAQYDEAVQELRQGAYGRWCAKLTQQNAELRRCLHDSNQTYLQMYEEREKLKKERDELYGKNDLLCKVIDELRLAHETAKAAYHDAIRLQQLAQADVNELRAKLERAFQHEMTQKLPFEPYCKLCRKARSEIKSPLCSYKEALAAIEGE